ncbi:MAG TPA: EamA family transporter, partial [Acidobacteriota bacterium]|nr:EamA family transporter [Acidobacteriota bacterium]
LFFFRDQLSPAGFTGNIVAIIAGVGFAGITLFLRLDQLKMSQQHGSGHSAHVSAVVSVALGNILAALIGLPWMISSPPPTVAGWLVVVGLGMVQIALAYLFFTAGVARLTAIESTLLALVEPILNPIWVALGTGETPSRSALIGGTMIVASVTVRGIIQSLSPKLKAAQS